jgi:hypothetical protein
MDREKAAAQAPSAASRLTIPSPIPREPPVTRATLPANDRPGFSVMSILLVECNLTLWIRLSRMGFRLSDWWDDAGGSVKSCKERLETIIGRLTGHPIPYGRDAKRWVILNIRFH